MPFPYHYISIMHYVLDFSNIYNGTVANSYEKYNYTLQICKIVALYISKGISYFQKPKSYFIEANSKYEHTIISIYTSILIEPQMRCTYIIMNV